MRLQDIIIPLTILFSPPVLSNENSHTHDKSLALHYGFGGPYYYSDNKAGMIAYGIRKQINNKFSVAVNVSSLTSYKQLLNYTFNYHNQDFKISSIFNNSYVSLTYGDIGYDLVYNAAHGLAIGYGNSIDLKEYDFFFDIHYLIQHDALLDTTYTGSNVSYSLGLRYKF